MKRILFGFLFMLFAVKLQASYVLIYMDEKQKNHLKAYGVAYFALQSNIEVDWLLNYRGGSFAFKYNEKLEATCRIRGVSYDLVPDVQYTTILQEIANPEVNMDAVKLEKVPKVAVYTPSNKPHHPELPWDDAVTLVLDYAEIPFDKLYDEDVLDEKLAKYDWLHLQDRKSVV